MNRYLPYLIWSLLIGLMASDVITTTYLIQNGGLEGNIFMQGIVNNPLAHSVVKAMLLVVIFVGYIWLDYQNKVKWQAGKNLELILVACCCPIFAWAVGNNLSWIVGG